MNDGLVYLGSICGYSCIIAFDAYLRHNIQRYVLQQVENVRHTDTTYVYIYCM